MARCSGSRRTSICTGAWPGSSSRPPIGLAALCICLLGHYLGWLPGAVFLALSWIYGTQDSDGRPRPWAVLQLPHDSILAAVTAAALCIAGTCLYAIRGVRE